MGDAEALLRFLEAVERRRPDWRLSEAEGGRGLVMLTVRDVSGRPLSRPLPISLERARSELEDAVEGFIRVVDQRVRFARPIPTNRPENRGR